MNVKTTGGLVLLWVALVGFVYFFEIRGADERDRIHREAGRLLRVGGDSVNGLTVHRGDTTIVLARSEGRWRILEPVATGGDDGEIEGLIRTLQYMNLERVVADSARMADGQAHLSDFGLDRPNLALAITHADRVDSLFWGDRSPTGRYAYIRWSGHPGILAVGAPFRLKVEKGLFELRDRRVADFDNRAVRKVQIEEGDARIDVEKRSGEWRLTHPVEDQADDAAVRKLIYRLHNAEFTHMVAETTREPGRYGLEKPTLTVTIFEEERAEKSTVVIGRRKAGVRFPPYFATSLDKEMVFLVDSTFVADLRKTVTDLRFKRIFAFDTRGINRLRLAYRDRVVECTIDPIDNTWQVLEPKLHIVLGHRVRHFLRTIELLEAELFVAERLENPDIYGFDRPALEVTFWRDGAVAQKLIIGERDRKVYATGLHRPQVVRIDPKHLTNLKLDLVPVKPDVVQPDTIRWGEQEVTE